jgi:hypothetical protein
MLDAGVQTVLEVDERIGAPDLLSELLPSDQLAGASDEQGEDFRGLRPQLDLRPAFA